MEINHWHEQENSTMVIGLGHIICVFIMLFACLAFCALPYVPGLDMHTCVRTYVFT